MSGFRRIRYVRRHFKQTALQRSDQAIDCLNMTFRRLSVPGTELLPAERPKRRRMPPNVHRLSAKPGGVNGRIPYRRFFPGRCGAILDIGLITLSGTWSIAVYRTFPPHEAQVGQV